MKRETGKFRIDPQKLPNVLLIGNGLLRLSGESSSWDKLLGDISDLRKGKNLDGIPYAMQPEALLGFDAEKIQQRVSAEIKTLSDVHPLMKELLEIPFDAILTTNYTYEIEQTLSRKDWTKYTRKKSFYALDGNSQANHNTFVCNLVEGSDGRLVPIFHVHGEADRKRSMILSYYSYANSVGRLVEYNKRLGNDLCNCQQEGKIHECKSWLDYFLLGNVWAVGFGFDFSELDIWWGIERKAREKAEHGRLKAYLDENDGAEAKKNMLDVMNCCVHIYDSKEIGYEELYRRAILDIGNVMN